MVLVEGRKGRKKDFLYTAGDTPSDGVEKLELVDSIPCQHLQFIQVMMFGHDVIGLYEMCGCWSCGLAFSARSYPDTQHYGYVPRRATTTCQYEALTNSSECDRQGCWWAMWGCWKHSQSCSL